MEKLNRQSFENRKIAFVLSGGVIKAGAWHLGVALALQELGFTFKSNNNHQTSETSFRSQQPKTNKSLEIDTYIGSSAGALISCCLASGLSPDDIIHASLDSKGTGFRPLTYKDILSLRTPMKKPPRSKIYKPFEGFPFALKHILRPFSNISGFFSTTGLVDYLKKNVLKENSFENLAADLFIVATQLDHSRKVIFSKYHYPNPSHDSTSTYYTGIPISEAAAASMSVPPFYSPYPIKNPRTGAIDYYIDGEIRETLSTHVAFDHHRDIVISSWTHTPYHYHDEIGSLINYGLPAICVQAIYLLIQKKIVAARAQRKLAKDIIETVNDYMKNNKFSDEHRRSILTILERKFNHRKNVIPIDIYPKHSNYEMFFSSFFSLSTDLSAETIKMGYKRTFEVFKELGWKR